MDVKEINLGFDQSSLPMCIYDPDNLLIKAVNDPLTDLYGYSEDKMLDMTLRNLYSGNEASVSADQKTGKGDREDYARTWNHKKKNGEPLVVHFSSKRVFYNDQEYRLATFHDITEKIKKREKYELLFKKSLEGFMITHPSGKVHAANQAACNILGMSEEEIIERGRENIVVCNKKLKKALEKRAETGKYIGELTFIHKSGEKIPVEVASSTFTNYAGNKQSSIIFRNISRKKATERSLKKEQAYSDIILKSLPGVFFILNSEGRVIKWNDRAEEVFGMTAEEIRNRPATEFVKAEERGSVIEKIQKVFEEGNATVNLNLKTNHEKNPVYKFIANRFDENEESYLVGSGVDITQQINLEKEISSHLKKEHAQRKQAELDRDKLKHMFESAPSPKYVVEGDEFRYVIANAAYRKLVGQKDIIGKRLIDVAPEFEKEGHYDIIKRVYNTGKHYVGHEKPITVAGENGEQKQIASNITYEPLFDEQGEVYGIFAETINIQEQLEYRDELQKSLKEKKVLLSEIHHRVKNNLAIVSGMVQLQIFESDDNETIQQLIESQNRIKSIAVIHELLYQSKRFSQIKLGDKIKDLVRYISTSIAPAADIQVDYSLDPVVININQAVPLTLIINELVTNVFKHAFKHDQQGKVGMSLTDNDDSILLTITDNGQGLPESIDLNDPKSVGLKVINILTKQLNGDFAYINDEGTEATLEFQKRDKKGPVSNLKLEMIDS